MPRATPGQQQRQMPLNTSATLQNQVLEAAEDFQLRKRLGSAGAQDTGSPIPTDVVKVRITTNMPRGSVIELGDRLITDLDPRYLWYDWVPSGPNPESYWAITRHQIAGDTIGEAQVAGVCIARVDMLDIEHRYARVVTGSNVMESAGSGPVRLVQLATGTGEQELVVQLRYEPRVEVVELGTLTKTGDFYSGQLKHYDPGTNTWSNVRTVWIVDANE